MLAKLLHYGINVRERNVMTNIGGIQSFPFNGLKTNFKMFPFSLKIITKN